MPNDVRSGGCEFPLCRCTCAHTDSRSACPECGHAAVWHRPAAPTRPPTPRPQRQPPPAPPPAPASDALVREYEARMRCVVCMERPNDTVLLPCAHTRICRHCSSRVMSCPLCRETIVDRVHYQPI